MRYDNDMSTRRVVPVLICCAIIMSASYLVVVAAETNTVAPTPKLEPAATETIEIKVNAAAITAQAFTVFDVATGAVLASKNAEEKRPIASVTKLFSAAEVLEETALDDVVDITLNDIETEGRSGKLAAGEQYTNRELLWPLLLESSNDAATALMRANPDLLSKMNELATSKGLQSFNFSDASGLSAENTASAHDLAILTHELYRTIPHLFDITRLPQYVGEQTGWVNNNPFIDDENYRGGKHGFTYEAGRTGVFLFEEAGRTLGYVVLGSDDLVADISKLRQ